MKNIFYNNNKLKYFDYNLKKKLLIYFLLLFKYKILENK